VKPRLITHWRRIVLLFASLFFAFAGILYAGEKQEAGRVAVPQPTMLFLGFSVVGKDTLFAILAVDNKGEKLGSSTWVAKGATFRDAQVLDFNRKEETLYIKRGDGDIQQLKLKDGRITHKKPDPLPREEALLWLDRYAHQHDEKFKDYPAVILDFYPEASASDEEKRDIVESRDQYKKIGQLYMVARLPNGQLVSSHGPPMPKSFMPEFLTANLTNDDWEDFLVKLDAISLIHAHQERLRREEKSRQTK